VIYYLFLYIYIYIYISVPLNMQSLHCIFLLFSNVFRGSIDRIACDLGQFRGII
jgi:hypothetical protein